LLEVLGSEVYGLWSILIAIISFASLADLGVSSAVVKYVAQFSVSDDSHQDLSTAVLFSFIFLLLVGFFSGALLYGLREWIVSRMALLTVPPLLLADAISITALGLVPFFLGQLPRGILMGLIRNEISGGINLAQQVTLLVGALVIGLWGGNIFTLALWGLLTNSIMCLLSAYFAWRVTQHFRSRPAWNARLIREMSVYSLISWAANLGSALFNSADRILVGVVLGPVAAGVYSIAAGVATKINYSLSPFVDMLMPFTSSYQAAGHNAQVQFAFRYGSRFAACLVVAVASILVLWSKPILAIWISPQFSDEHFQLFQILVVCYAVFSMNAPAYKISRGLGLLVVPSAIVTGAGLATLGLMAVLTSSFGLTGAVVANFVYVLTLSINLYVARKLKLELIASVLKPLGPPLLVLMVLTILVQSIRLSTPVALIVTVIILALLLWMVIEFEGGTKLLKAIAAEARSQVLTDRWYLRFGGENRSGR